MNDHPYKGLPDYQFWKAEPAISNAAAFDPIKNVAFKICKTEPIMTAGSCFAQHVARYLANSGYNYLVTEQAHSLIPEALSQQFNYGAFTARYGNIYTARQLKQLLQRAYGLFSPIQRAWRNREGAVVDPFRPQIQEGGFVSEAELDHDREVHFAAIRNAVESASVFVFTLGLTETWRDKRDGSVYPLAPGIAGGVYDSEVHEFCNFEVCEVIADLHSALEFFRKKNPSVKFLLTVSPVPLNATAEDRHVFVSTCYSKSVLRATCDTISKNFADCEYFPSYEIITSPYSRGAYYGPDCREVTEAGVKHVMSIFLRHYGDEHLEGPPPTGQRANVPESSDFLEKMESIVKVLCDEELITNK